MTNKVTKLNMQQVMMGDNMTPNIGMIFVMVMVLMVLLMVMVVMVTMVVMMVGDN